MAAEPPGTGEGTRAEPTSHEAARHLALLTRTTEVVNSSLDLQDVLEAIMLDFRRRGATVLFSTHLMDQAERLCERVCLISRGRRVLEGDLAQIKQREQSRLHEIFVRYVGAAGSA